MRYTVGGEQFDGVEGMEMGFKSDATSIYSWIFRLKRAELSGRENRDMVKVSRKGIQDLLHGGKLAKQGNVRTKRPR